MVDGSSGGGRSPYDVALGLVSHEDFGPGDYVVVLDDGEGPAVIALSREWMRLGRSLAADIRFEDATVSRRHALFVRRPQGVLLMDDRSANGVLVNGEPVESHMLVSGDVITVGRHTLVFVSVALDRSSAIRSPELPREWAEQIGPVWTLAELLERFAGPEDDGGGVAVQAKLDIALERLLALFASEGDVVYPDFQFDQDGDPYPVVAEVLEIFAGSIDMYTVAAWFTAPNRDLQGRTPAACLAAFDDRSALIAAASRLVARLGR